MPLLKKPSKERVLLGFCAGTGLVCISLAAWWHPPSDAAFWKVMAHEVLRDLGIALLIAATIATLIELTLARDLALKGIEAAMKEIVNPAVWKEIREHIIRQPVKREKFYVTVRIEDKFDGHYVAATTIEYELTRLTPLPSWHIRHDLDSYTKAKDRDDRDLPRYEAVEVDGRRRWDEKNIHEIYEGLNRFVVRPEISLGRAATRHVKVVAKQIIKAPDTSTLWMPLVTHGLTFKVINDNYPELQFRVRALHPERERLRRMNEGDDTPVDGGWKSAHEWCFGESRRADEDDVTLLPGQGLDVQTRLT